MSHIFHFCFVNYHLPTNHSSLKTLVYIYEKSFLTISKSGYEISIELAQKLHKDKFNTFEQSTNVTFMRIYICICISGQHLFAASRPLIKSILRIGFCCKA